MTRTPDEIKKGLGEAVAEASWVVDDGDMHDLRDALDNARARMADALALIHQLEAQVPRWISVEERLPEDGVEVLICTICGDVTWAYYRYNRMEWFRNCIRFTQTVTHWMPMPEPPKEESK